MLPSSRRCLVGRSSLGSALTGAVTRALLVDVSHVVSVADIVSLPLVRKLEPPFPVASDSGRPRRRGNAPSPAQRLLDKQRVAQLVKMARN